MLDLLIEGGKYPDFKSEEIRKANIGVRDGKIVFIGKDRPESKKVIYAYGRIVSPGFIDIHMHEEDFVQEGQKYVISKMMLKMGVTTAVGGNCGLQKQPLKQFKNVIEKTGGSPINYLMLAGYNQFRNELGIGRYDSVSPLQKQKIYKAIKEELEQGAIGISFGIEYDPGITTEEIVEILNCFDDSSLLAAVHYRNSCTKDTCAIKEMVEIAGRIPMKFQISHLSSCSAMGGMEESLKIIDEAMERNVKLNFDTYPYNAFSTHVGSEVFEDGCLDRWQKDYDCILLTEEPYKNVRCTKSILEDVRKNYPSMLAVVFAMNEDEIRKAIACKNGMIASDGIINGGKGHPRAAGTFPRVLGKYVREDKVIDIKDALRKITFEPAKRLGLCNKGRIELGCDADITIFNPDTISDGATFTDIDIPSEGIDYVLVNGQVAVHDKKVVNDRLGRFVSYKEII